MNVIAVNGSPRKNRNTAAMLEKALEGAASAGAHTELIHPYSMTFKGCSSCLACKRLEGERRCFMRDELTPVLERMREADVLIFGSPLYFYGVTSGLRALMERFFYPGVTYDQTRPTFYTKTVPNAMIYTMNVGPELFEQQQHVYVRYLEGVVGRHLKTPPEILCAHNTMQYDDYSKYEHTMFSVEDKLNYCKNEFPKELERAYALGVRLVERAHAQQD